MKQPLLWDQTPQASDGARIPPATARADQATSRAAEEQHTASGKRLRNADRVLSLVRDNPGSTYVELWQKQAWQPGSLSDTKIMRRLSDLAAKGLVRRGEPRNCTIRKNLMTTWLPEESR